MPDPDHILTWLRRDKLIHSWEHTDDGIDVVVGRGTIRLPPQDPSEIAPLAARLRRDTIATLGTGYPMGHRTTRYDLSDGRFADRHDSRIDRYLDPLPYTVLLPGGDPGGSAAVHFAAATKTEALALATLYRIRGRCLRCGTDRPLLARTWSPDPAIRCPGCRTDDQVPVQLHCRTCTAPIAAVRDTTRRVGLSRVVWEHTTTGSAYCATNPVGATGFERPRARP
ncbi:hypothetical protein MOQ72_34150 [Saccharopolyspora sp. K220]|uniref:hypothetical protein n=1 Tax=Saccharopolyspora soli TaxID=2926618 RepID=UPI001F58208B|nr:hypothetical protein [Saccharopolyspora soli]MCI2422482.1 hypothetical protein [Saccharopolyspora soli]